MIKGTAYGDWAYFWDTVESGDRETFYYEHEARNAKTNERRSIDWLSREEMSRAEFGLWVALEMPGRQGIGPLNRNDLMTLALQKITKEEKR